MRCLLCGDEIGGLLGLRDRDFCCSGHRERYHNALQGFLIRAAEPDPIDFCIPPPAPLLALRRIRPCRHAALDRSFLRPPVRLMEPAPARVLRVALPPVDRDEPPTHGAPVPENPAPPPARCQAPGLTAALSDLRASVLSVRESLADCVEIFADTSALPRLKSDPAAPGLVRPLPFLVASRRRGAA